MNDVPNIVDDEQSLDKVENALSSSNNKKISSTVTSGTQDDNLSNSLDSKDKRRHYLIKSKEFLHIGK
jgi:hypothetical protein